MALLTLVFLLPIGILFLRAVDNGNAAELLPRTAAILAEWDGISAPEEPFFAALAGDLQQAPKEKVAELAKQLNYTIPGMRSKFIATARHARSATAPFAAGMIETDPAWATPRYLTALQRAIPAVTDFYLLAALDLQRNESGAIGAVPEAEALNLEVLSRTFTVSLSVTLMCLLLGYPLAALMSRAKGFKASLLLILVLLPFWTSLLVRTSAWVVLLQSRGVVNTLLAWMGLIDPNAPLELIYNRIGVVIAMTHILLPFMILPIYSVMKSIPPVYTRAAASLGARPFATFWRVYLPMTMPGVSAGALLVFILALGYYITPALVGGPKDQMISYFIAYYANQVTNWGMAAALSAILVAAVLLLYVIYNRLVGIQKLRVG
ncbi:ABC transporter permease [Pseudogemmobacter faecipullorum]|nr:ABC transporter permease [Pseudogemmobacter faecipullorum]